MQFKNQKKQLLLSFATLLQLISCPHANPEVGEDPATDYKVKQETHRHAHNHTFSKNGNVLRVLNLNTWGLGWPISSDRVARFRALREVIAHSDYDVILLQEVWYRSDHELLRTALPYSTYFGIFNSGCSGYLLPLGCSGLTILSRYPFVDVEFTPFNERGSFWSFDGEIFVQKGLGRARIIWGPEKVSIDLFTTHLVSYTNNPNRDNNRIRYMQTLETVQLIDKTDADVKIFAGDVNALPFPGIINGKRQPYSLLTSILTDSLVDRYPDASWHPWFATFGNHHNTYSASDAPERIDYLMYWAAPQIAMCTLNFTMPMYTTKNRKGDTVSLSDHEALNAEFLIERRISPQQIHRKNSVVTQLASSPSLLNTADKKPDNDSNLDRKSRSNVPKSILSSVVLKQRQQDQEPKNRHNRNKNNPDSDFLRWYHNKPRQIIHTKDLEAATRRFDEISAAPSPKNQNNAEVFYAGKGSERTNRQTWLQQQRQKYYLHQIVQRT